MNKRIKELALQAMTATTNKFSADREWSADEWRDFYDTKFAELIVQECSRVIVNGGYWSGGPIGPKRQCTPPEIAQMIREHFGVEE